MLNLSSQTTTQPAGWRHRIGIFPGIVLLLVLALTLAACGGNDEPASTPTPVTAAETAPPAATTQPAPTATTAPVQEAAAPVPPVADPEYLPPGKVLKSFRSRSESIFSTTYADGTIEEEHSVFLGAFTLTDGPFGYDEVFELYELGHGDGEIGEATPEMVIYSVGDGMAVATGSEWSVANRAPLGQPSPAFEVFTGLPGEIADAIDQARSLGAETVNGVETTHYRVDERAAFESMLNTVMSDEEGEIQQLGYDVWIAQGSKFVVKYDFVIQVADAQTTDADGNLVTADEITVRWSYELFDINEEFTIDWPEAAPRPGEVNLPGFEEDAFPLPPGGEIESTMFGIVAIVSSESLADVMAFYEETLTELGWTQEGEGGFYTWTKGEVSLSMVIGPDEQGGTRVTILPE